jgi:NAD-dependent deacetylase
VFVEQFPRKSISVITMNVDGLHQDAGSQNVYEVHGTVRRFVCRNCNVSAALPTTLPVGGQWILTSATQLNSYIIIYLINLFQSEQSSIPRCKESGCGGYIRPDVTLFGEALPANSFERSFNAVHHMRSG